jgi:hypothetical protein
MTRLWLTTLVVVWSTFASAEEPAPTVATGAEVAPEQKAPLPTDEQKPIGAEAAKPSKVNVFGYVKVGYFFTGPTTDDALVGSRNGFRLANLRVGVSFQPVERISIVASVDGSVARRAELDPLNGSRVVELRDAYAEWTARPWFRLRLGQFKAPFNAESLLGDGALPFVSRSIISEGLTPPEGFPLESLSMGRQLGLMADSERLGSGLLGLRYAVALVNGNGSNALNNDNNVVTPVGRLVLEVGQTLAVGVNASYDVATFGSRPGRLTERRLGAGADVAFTYEGLSVVGVLLWRNLQHAEVGGTEQGLGAMGSVAYVHAPTGLEAGVRVAYYEPSNLQPSDQQLEAAAMLGYRASFFPGRLILQYTLRVEEPSASIGNNSIDLMVQVSF